MSDIMRFSGCLPGNGIGKSRAKCRTTRVSENARALLLYFNVTPYIIHDFLSGHSYIVVDILVCEKEER